MLASLRSNRSLGTTFGALVVVLGLQSMRFLFGSISWYLRDTIGIGVLDLIPIAIAPFLLGLVLPVLSRWLSVRTTLWLGITVLGAARVVNQAATDPAVDFWSAAVATAALVGLLPLLLSIGRFVLVGGVLLGLAIDGAIKGAALSLDLAFMTGVVPLLVVVGLIAAMAGLMARLPDVERRGVAWGPGTALLAFGPFLLLQGLIMQNQGWISEMTGLAGATTQFVIAGLNLLALAVVRFERWRVARLLGLLVFAGAAAMAETEGWFGVLVFLAIPAGGLVLGAMVPDTDRPALGASATHLVTASTLYVLLGLAYYVPIDLDLGFTQADVRLAAVGLLVVLGLIGVVQRTAEEAGVVPGAWALAGLAVLVSLGGVFVGLRPADPGTPASGLRAMAYNIHSSYDTDGVFDIEAIAEVIEASGATVVGLQEVPRGRLLSGVTDQLTILQHRLGFEHVAFFGTTDPSWGNAILSRYPIEGVETRYLPLVGTPMRRGYLGADLDVGGETVLFISTHLQHVNDRAVHDDDPEADLYPVHHEQIGTILEAWDGQEPAVLVGDFNARPGWRQIDELLAAGWVDSWAEVGVGEGFTARSNDPRYRIDYVFVTPGLRPIEAVVPQSTASDHFPVVVDVATP